MKKTFPSESLTTVNGTVVSIHDFLPGIKSYVKKAKSSFRLTREDAEELYQDASMKLLEKVSGFDETKSSTSYFGYLVAHNHHVDVFSKKRPEILSLSILMPYEDDDSKDYIYDSMAVDYDTPESLYCAKELMIELHGSINNLKDVDREIINMRNEGYKPREIALKLGMKPSVVHTRLCRIKKTLKHSA